MPLLMTHGQPATPTTLGKGSPSTCTDEPAAEHLESQEYLGKINSAGTFGAHLAALPQVDLDRGVPRVRGQPRKDSPGTR